MTLCLTYNRFLCVHRYYRRRVGPKVDVRLVLAVTISLISLGQVGIGHAHLDFLPNNLTWNFPMTPPVRLSVGPSVNRSVPTAGLSLFPIGAEVIIIVNSLAPTINSY